jgi:hypothetical protein
MSIYWRVRGMEVFLIQNLWSLCTNVHAKKNVIFVTYNSKHDITCVYGKKTNNKTHGEHVDLANQTHVVMFSNLSSWYKFSKTPKVFHPSSLLGQFFGHLISLLAPFRFTLTPDQFRMSVFDRIGTNPHRFIKLTANRMQALPYATTEKCWAPQEEAEVLTCREQRMQPSPLVCQRSC